MELELEDREAARQLFERPFGGSEVFGVPPRFHRPHFTEVIKDQWSGSHERQALSLAGSPPQLDLFGRE
jgi:hypothetical protein